MRVCVTGLAVCDGFNIFKNFVLYIQMALVALNFVFSDVLIMHEISVVIFIETFLFHMAFVAVFSWDDAISHYGVAVTFAAVISVIENKRMVISGCFF